MKNAERIVNFALAELGYEMRGTLGKRLNETVFERSVKQTLPTETMSSEDAMHFPFVGSAMLLSLFLLFKFLSKDLVNAVLTCYFFVLGIIALSETIVPAIKRFLPKYWNEHLIVWHFPYFCSLEVEFARSQIIAAIPETFFCAWYVRQKLWLANWALLFAFRELKCSLLDPSRLGLMRPEGKEASIFKSAFLGYTTGSVLTIVVMNWSQAAQPAPLYIVPTAIEFLAAHIVWNVEVKPLLEFDESKTTATSEENSDNKTSKKLE